jgi:ubiquitin-conjugating enzyme E2 J1
MASPSTRRLLKESSDLHKNPSPYFTASPTGDGNLHDWHFTLAGPPSSPYSQGLYHGRITFPATYPLRPPSFRFLTPSGRFEVNREICLSISGHHEETWQPAWGVRTALLAIRSEIFGSESQGQVGGMEGSEELRKEYARLSLDWTCRECGVGNLEGMKEVWDSCREHGVEVDVDIAGGKSDTQTGVETQASTQTQDDTPVPANQNPEPVQMLTSHEHTTPAALVQAPSAPPGPSTQAPAQVPLPAVIPTQTVPIQLPTVESPSESVWLDRAIIGVVIALVLLVLRRVSNVDDL